MAPKASEGDNADIGSSSQGCPASTQTGDSRGHDAGAQRRHKNPFNNEDPITPGKRDQDNG